MSVGRVLALRAQAVTSGFREDPLPTSPFLDERPVETPVVERPLAVLDIELYRTEESTIPVGSGIDAGRPLAP